MRKAEVLITYCHSYSESIKSINFFKSHHNPLLKIKRKKGINLFKGTFVYKNHPSYITMEEKEIFSKQLFTGCKKQNCVKAFCRKIENPELIETISSCLCEYDNVFLCVNINKLINGEINLHKFKNKENWCMNLLFHYLDLFKNQNGSGNINSYSPYIDYELEDDNLPSIDERCNRNDKRPLKNITNSKRFIKETIEKDVGELSIIEDENVEHLYCKFINNKNLEKEELYLITGIVNILVKKYDKFPSYDLGLLILRLYSMVSTYSCTDTYNLSIILQIFDHIHNFDNKKCDFRRCKLPKPESTNEIINVTFEDQNTEDIQEMKLNDVLGDPQNVEIDKTYCTKFENFKGDCKRNLEDVNCYLCLNKEKFIKNDLYRLVNNFRETLNRLTETNIRENRRVELMLNIFYAMFVLNEKFGIMPCKKFYLNQFCTHLSFKEEYKFYRTKGKTVLNYSFILPLHTKAELLKSENNDLMKSSLQDSFFRSLFEGHVEPYLFITVSRDNIYADSFEILKNIRFEDMHKQLRITFKNEEGVDSGGIRKEYFQLLSHEIKHDINLFNNLEHTLWLKNDCLSVEKYYCIGKILGIALYNNVVLNIPFPSFFFKKLLNRKTCFNDLKEIDSNLHLSLSNLKKLDSKEIEELDLNFTVVYTTSTGEVKSYNLDELDRNLKVTKENVSLFINKYADLFLNKLIKKQFDAIKEGFYFVINKDILTYLYPKELEKIIIGSNNFNINEIRSTTSYNGYEENSPIIEYFWNIFESYNKKMKKKLLQFITGHDRIPVAGSSSLKLVIMKNGCDTDRLPSSQTCFNTLLLPEYSSKEKFEGKLKTALEMTAGFFLL